MIPTPLRQHRKTTQSLNMFTMGRSLQVFASIPQTCLGEASSVLSPLQYCLKMLRNALLLSLGEHQRLERKHNYHRMRRFEKR